MDSFFITRHLFHCVCFYIITQPVYPIYIKFFYAIVLGNIIGPITSIGFKFIEKKKKTREYMV